LGWNAGADTDTYAGCDDTGTVVVGLNSVGCYFSISFFSYLITLENCASSDSFTSASQVLKTFSFVSISDEILLAALI